MSLPCSLATWSTTLRVSTGLCVFATAYYKQNSDLLMDTHGDEDNPGESSHRKGKTVDPSNWGATGLTENKLDPNAQQAMLEDINLHA